MDNQNTKIVSAITFWEISLKYQLGKLNLSGVLPEQLPRVALESGFQILDLDFDTAATFYKLPKLKKDPFDRMLAWQAISKNYTLLTKDPDFSFYQSHGLETVL